jgi:hypothetical protein
MYPLYVALSTKSISWVRFLFLFKELCGKKMQMLRESPEIASLSGGPLLKKR